MFFKRNGYGYFGRLAITAFAVAGMASAQDFTASEAVQASRHSKPKLFQADYGFRTSNNCVRAIPHPPSLVGIDPDTRTLLLPGEVVSQGGGGVMHFFKDGRLTVDATASEVNLSQVVPGAFPQTDGLVGTCRGSYTLSSGNRVALHFNCHVDIPSQGVSFDLGPTNAEGFISENGVAVNLNQTDDLQTVTLKLPNGATLVSERVCVQSFALTRISSNSKGTYSKASTDED